MQSTLRVRCSTRPAVSARRTAAKPVVVCSPRCSGLVQRRTPLQIVCASGLAAPNEEQNREAQGPLGQFSSSMGVPNFTMAGGNFGSGGSLGATLERAKQDFVMPTPVVKGPKLDDGGSGGDIGKNNRNGGGGGDGGGGDDDDYFEEGDGEGEGGRGSTATAGLFRSVIPESYDKLSIGAVFAEWMRTLQELPSFMRQAVTMGLFSSAQLVRFFSMDVRPSVTRTVARRLPLTVGQALVGRLMADPGFAQKMVLEAVFAASASLFYEYRVRGDKFKEELDLALINTLGMALATSASVWLLAPSRSYGAVAKMPWQTMLKEVPNCVFDASTPLRNYNTQSRAVGWLAGMAQLAMVGTLTGAATSVLSSAAVEVHKKANPDFQPSVPVPHVGASAGGLGAFFAANAHTRYQLLGGIDRFLFDRTTFLWTYLAMSGAARLAGQYVSEMSRPVWQGLPAAAALQRPSVPMPRKVRKKVSKKVPRARVQQQQAAASTADATAPVMAAATTMLLPAGEQPAAGASWEVQQQQDHQLQSTAQGELAAPEYSSSTSTQVYDSQPATTSYAYEAQGPVHADSSSSNHVGTSANFPAASQLQLAAEDGIESSATASEPRSHQLVAAHQ